MKIAIFWEQNSWGGVDTHIITLLKYWKNNNDDIHLFVNVNNLGYQRIKKDIDKISNVSVIQFSSNLIINSNEIFLIRLFKIIFRPFLFITESFKISKMFKSFESYDALLSQNGAYPGAWTCIAAIISAKKCNITKRIMLIHHEAMKPRYYQSLFERFIDYLLVKSATDIIAVSLATRESLYTNRATFFNHPIKVIYNGIETNNIDNLPPSGINLREKYKIDENKILIGIVGRIEKYKGHEDLISGYSLLEKYKQNQIVLLFIGSGAKEEIERLNNLKESLKIQNNIIFSGYLEGDPRLLIKQLNLLCVLTKDFEGFGLTIGESMAIGTPVLVTKVGAIPEFVTNDVGTLIDPESPSQVYKVLDHFISNSEPYKLKATKAKEHIKKYSAERLVEDMKTVFKTS
jgi:glycosyltransferase involved in cell wall biosynthesis